jgi:GR25 family glycosyltransferase involved in LPS biosynthesis
MYVINLEQRTDRWDSVISESLRNKLDLTRVDAVVAGSIDASNCIYMPPGVVATWKSHQSVFREFLSTSDPYCLILEDDFVVPRMSHKLNAALHEGYASFDFIQVGFLITSNIEYVDFKLQNWFDMLKKLLSIQFFRLGRMRYFSNKLTVSEQIGVPSELVLNDIRAGGHAYIISRRFAEAGLKMNEPVFFSTDGVFMALGKSRNFKMARFRKPFINQTNSPTSVSQRFI